MTSFKVHILIQFLNGRQVALCNKKCKNGEEIGAADFCFRSSSVLISSLSLELSHCCIDM